MAQSTGSAIGSVTLPDPACAAASTAASPPWPSTAITVGSSWLWWWRRDTAWVCVCLLACTLTAHPDRGKLLLTGGVAASTVPAAAA